jgi:hypothetical protein
LTTKIRRVRRRDRRRGQSSGVKARGKKTPGKRVRPQKIRWELRDAFSRTHRGVRLNDELLRRRRGRQPPTQLRGIMTYIMGGYGQRVGVIWCAMPADRLHVVRKVQRVAVRGRRRGMIVHPRRCARCVMACL